MFLHYYVVLFSRKLSAKIILSPSALSSFCLPARLSVCLSVCLSVWSGRGCPWSPREGLLDGHVSQSVSFPRENRSSRVSGKSLEVPDILLPDVRDTRTVHKERERESSCALQDCKPSSTSSTLEA